MAGTHAFPKAKSGHVFGRGTEGADNLVDRSISRVSTDDLSFCPLRRPYSGVWRAAGSDRIVSDVDRTEILLGFSFPVDVSIDLVSPRCEEVID